MPATLINAGCVALFSLFGIAIGGRLKPERTETLVCALGICTAVIGIMSAIETANILLVILCIAFGTILGELFHIEARMDGLGGWLKKKVLRGREEKGNFTEGFVSASLLFCVGSMAIMGSLEAGINGDYSIILSKTALDSVMAVTFSATMGLGVVFSAGTVLLYQGAITLLANWVSPFLSTAVVTEMTAVGGVMLIGTGINIMGISPKRIQVGNMLPAILLPLLAVPLESWLGGLF